MRFSFIEEQKAVFSINLMCKVLCVTRSGFYAWRGREESEHSRRDRQLTVKVRAFHEASRGTYGSPRIHKDLEEDGEAVGRKRVARIMEQEGLTGLRPRAFRRTTDSKHNLPVAENIVDRNFSPEAQNQVWAGDITYVRTWQGWLYVAVVLDLFSRRVIGWAIADHMRTELALDALMMAVDQRHPPHGVIFHSDRGSQYASHAYQNALDANGMVCSMSRKGDCWDNSVVESFFGSLKEDLIYRHQWPSKAKTMQSIAEYIACFYNSHRRHNYIDNISPNEYERRMLAA